MHVLTAAQMREAEQMTFTSGIPAEALMEVAGKSVAEAAREMLQPGGRVAVVCGAGNNGGDGFVAARYLLNQGMAVSVILTRAPEGLSGYAGQVLAPLADLGANVQLLTNDAGSVAEVRRLLHHSDVIIDALLGTGAEGPLRGAVQLAAGLIRAAERPVIAVDIPTGVASDSGAVVEDAVRAEVTVAMGAPKLGHLLLPGRLYCGRLVVADVGIPYRYVQAVSQAEWIQPETAGAWFPPRPVASHKGTFGSVLVVAGSYNMPGAAVLTVQAALRSGAGLVSWAGPESVWNAVSAHAPEATLFPLAEQDGMLSSGAVDAAAALLEGRRAVAVGPGLGLSKAVEEFVADLLSRTHVPAVVDADALTHLARIGGWPKDHETPRVLTPHPKEMARLLHTTVEDVQADRMGAVREAAQRYRSTVLLKGFPTLVADPSGYAGIVPAGNPVLSVGGTGDVLTGLIAGLLAQGVTPWRAACLGALWHGSAGDLLAKDGHDAAHTAGELVARLAAARAALRAARGRTDDGGTA